MPEINATIEIGIGNGIGAFFGADIGFVNDLTENINDLKGGCFWQLIECKGEISIVWVRIDMYSDEIRHGSNSSAEEIIRSRSVGAAI